MNLKVSAPIPQVILELDQQQKTIEEYTIKTKIQQTLIEGFRMSIKAAEMSLISVLLLSSSEMKFEELILEVIKPWQKNRSDIFDFLAGNAFYNIAVYLKEEDVLKLKARLCDDRISRNDREWRVGEGHVGSCFIQKKLIIMEDISPYPLADESKVYPSDKVYYRSFMGYPLRYIDQVVGVVVVTSSEPNQFSAIIHSERIGLLAKSLEICIHLNWSRYNVNSKPDRSTA